MEGSVKEIDEAWWRATEATPGATTLALGAPFRPGLDPLPSHQEAWAVVKDRWGRPAHGEPRDALRPVVTRVPAIGPNEALGYVLYAGLTYNTIFAARGVPVSVFELHDQDLHVAGSGAVVLVAALGHEVAREGRLRVGELRVLYPGVSNLLSPRAGDDPMHADFKIQGYETPDGSFAQFVRCQAPQLLAHSERLTLAEGSSFMLDLETVYKALYDRARVEADERVFVEGAAGGTGLYAVACAVLRGARVTGLVSTEDKGKLVVGHGASAYVNRARPELARIFVPVPREPGALAVWIADGERFTSIVRQANGGAPVDVVVSSVGRDLFGRMIDLLGPGGRLVFYGATTGYTLAFLGKPGAVGARAMLRRADLRPHEGVLVYYGFADAPPAGAPGIADRPVRMQAELALRYSKVPSFSTRPVGETRVDIGRLGGTRVADGPANERRAETGRVGATRISDRPPTTQAVHALRISDPVGAEAIEAALRARARVVAVTRTDAQAAELQAALAVQGVVSLETLARSPGFRWPEAMPDYDVDPAGYREYQESTLKPFGQAVGRLLATPDNPRGYPDLIVERAAQDSLGVSAFIARPFRGRVVYLEDTAGCRFSFYAPNVWMHGKRVLFPTFAILGSHLSNAHQAEDVVRLIDGGVLAVHPPLTYEWPELPEANQLIHENRHAGTLTVRVGATSRLDGARTAREVYEAWGSRFIDGTTVRVRLDPVRPGSPDLVALVTVDAPPANAIGRAVLDDLERAVDALEREPHLRAAVLTGAGAMFVAGADVRQLRAFAGAEDVEHFASRVQGLLVRIGRSKAPFVSAVDGYALGGGNELQMACAYRIASSRAELGQPEVNLHVIPGFGGTQMLPRLAVRHARAGGGQIFTLLTAALTLLLDGRRRPAAEARGLGLVDEVAPADALSHALGVARRIALGEFRGTLWSPLAHTDTMAFPNVERDPDVQRVLAHHRQIPRGPAAAAIVEIVRLGLTQGLEAGLAAEAREFGRLVASEDGRGGIDRFLARRSLPLPLRRE